VIEIGPSPSVVDLDIMTIYPAKLLECFRGRRSTHHCPRITVGKPEKHTNPSHACRLLGIERQWPNGNAPPKSMMNSRGFIRSPRETTELYARNTPGVGTKPPFGRFDTSTFIEVDREMRTRSYRPGMITIAARPQPSLATG
jgi:hypothetical protein